MSENTMNRVLRTAVLGLGLFASAVCFAHGGGGGGGHGGGGGYHGGGGGYHGGYYHGGGYHGGYYHGGGYHGGYYHGGGYHGGYYHGGGWGGWGGPGIVIGAPFYGDYYGGCQTVRVCNPYGHCWLQQSCY